MVINKLHEEAEKAISNYDSGVSSHNHNTLISNFKDQLNKEGFNVVELLSIVSNNDLEVTTIFKTDFKPISQYRNYATCFVLYHNAKKKVYEMSIGYADLEIGNYAFYLTGEKISKSYLSGKYTVGIEITHGDIYDLVTDLKYEFSFKELLKELFNSEFNTKIRVAQLYDNYFTKPEFKDHIFNIALNKAVIEDVVAEAMNSFAKRNRTIEAYNHNFNTLLNKLKDLE